MQFQNKLDRNRIAYLGALTLLFSYAEMFLPRILPFFRLGLGNVVILLAFNLDFCSFLVLNLIKIIATALLNGTLFSPFLLISLAQGFSSAIVMYLLAAVSKNKKHQLLSVYGISLAGSAVSTVMQILTSSFYLGKGTFSLLGPMLIFSVVSGVITAVLSQMLHLPKSAPRFEGQVTVETATPPSKIKKILPILLILLSAIVCMMLHHLYILLSALICALFIQHITGRKIFILPHISLWIFVLLCALLSPNGKILFKISGFSVTQGALVEGIEKALKLSIISALSQSAAGLKPDPASKSLLNLTLIYFRGLSDIFRNTEGKLLKRLSVTLSATEINN